ncbi:MFS transporter [Parafrankia sp. FMc2]|uniref:MFS transporter n=1 Tax=Parafrankia sp. FMc2 TaxID=3233196 RepID=UPI0034D72925
MADDGALAGSGAGAESGDEGGDGAVEKPTAVVPPVASGSADGTAPADGVAAEPRPAEPVTAKPPEEVPAAAQAPTRGPARRAPAWAVLAVCCLAQFMVVLDVTIVNVALPSMQSDLGLSASGLQWVVNGYTLAFAGLLLFGGRAADLFGRRRVFVTGLTLFTAASLAGGLATTEATLIAARAVQGLGGAVLAPATLSVLMTSFPDPRERARALGLWSTTAAGGGALGVLAGGLLTQIADWRWVFFVNVPIGLALIMGARIALVESRGQARGVRDLDVPGTVTVTGGLVALVYGIVRTESGSWGSPVTLGWLAAAVVLLAAFVVIELRTANPLVPLGVFRRRALRYANLIILIMGTVMFGLFFFLTLYLQRIQGQEPLEAGLSMLPMPLMIIVGSQFSSRMVGRLGPRPLVIAGTLTAATGMAWLGALSAGGSYWTQVFGPLALFGLGMGTNMVAVTTAATSGVPPQIAGLASGLLNTGRQIGAAVGLALLATIAHHHSEGRLAAGTLEAEALTSGYSLAFVISAGLLLLAAVVACLLPGLPPAVPVTVAEQPRGDRERLEALAEA